MRLVETSHAGTDMIRAPNATEVSHLFALAEHEIVKGRFTEALILLRFIRSIDPEHTDAAARLALTLFPVGSSGTKPGTHSIFDLSSWLRNRRLKFEPRTVEAANCHAGAAVNRQRTFW